MSGRQCSECGGWRDDPNTSPRRSGRSPLRLEFLLADKARMDWLESELAREGDIRGLWTRSLFRRNEPITRASIDAAMREVANHGK